MCVVTIPSKCTQSQEKKFFAPDHKHVLLNYKYNSFLEEINQFRFFWGMCHFYGMAHKQFVNICFNRYHGCSESEVLAGKRGLC